MAYAAFQTTWSSKMLDLQLEKAQWNAMPSLNSY